MLRMTFQSGCVGRGLQPRPQRFKVSQKKTFWNRLQTGSRINEDFVGWVELRCTHQLRGFGGFRYALPTLHFITFCLMYNDERWNMRTRFKLISKCHLY